MNLRHKLKSQIESSKFRYNPDEWKSSTTALIVFLEETSEEYRLHEDDVKTLLYTEDEIQEVFHIESGVPNHKYAFISKKTYNEVLNTYYV